MNHCVDKTGLKFTEIHKTLLIIKFLIIYFHIIFFFSGFILIQTLEDYSKDVDKT